MENNLNYIPMIPAQELKERRDKKIKQLFKEGYSMKEICSIVGCSKTTVFFAIKGRAKKKVVKV